VNLVASKPAKHIQNKISKNNFLFNKSNAALLEIKKCTRYSEFQIKKIEIYEIIRLTVR